MPTQQQLATNAGGKYTKGLASGGQKLWSLSQQGQHEDPALRCVFRLAIPPRNFGGPKKKERNELRPGTCPCCHRHRESKNGASCQGYDGLSKCSCRADGAIFRLANGITFCELCAHQKEGLQQKGNDNTVNIALLAREQKEIAVYLSSISSLSWEEASEAIAFQLGDSNT